ncbi:hypothetical protein PCASD_23209 [Puccinia coronata f. sp. avenae]|uniref:Uncharacterized protein n=1 Tax=Puccinia coronata f. sp. avenae TaxID=200324 RepID=A0A2N5S072_9BASI|nr:hypothetical protein PCASD_23209 [Puccinia coronata f. sp. avenae]
MISGTNKFGSDVGVMISKKKAQLNHSHSKKFPWEILSSDLESHTDSTFSDSENFTEEVPADENSSPEKLKEEPQNDSQYDTKDSQEVEIMEKESRPRKSSGERKKKSKKLKKAQPETVKNTWGSTKDDEENVGKRNGKSQMTNPEKLKKGYEEKQGIGSRQVASEQPPSLKQQMSEMLGEHGAQSTIPGDAGHVGLHQGQGQQTVTGHDQHRCQG